MDDKKIYKLLQSWFPELQTRKIPKAKNRRDFEQFRLWLIAEKQGKHERAFLMPLNPTQVLENHLANNAVLQDLKLNFAVLQQQLRVQIEPLLAHYAQHKQVIGKYYNVNEQVLEIALREICMQLHGAGSELLVIYAEHPYWIAVPAGAEKIEKFCKKFEKQFKNEQIAIEIFSVADCLKST